MLAIDVREGDISRCEADALVNAANNHFWMGSGVAGALKRVGGVEIEEQAISQGPVAVGEVVVTGAGKLKARYVIHAAVMGQDLRTGTAVIKKATENSLRCADGLECKSIAFPALGTGVGGFSLEECARLMIGTLKDYGTGKTGIERVILILYGEPAYRIFATELERQMK
jgi:O-acetyl-ADP-ribose deacetylase (regulator of RNase III)